MKLNEPAGSPVRGLHQKFFVFRQRSSAGPETELERGPHVVIEVARGKQLLKCLLVGNFNVIFLAVAPHLGDEGKFNATVPGPVFEARKLRDRG